MQPNKKPGACEGHRAPNEITAAQLSHLGGGSAISISEKRQRLNALDRLHRVTLFFDSLSRGTVTENRIREARLELLEPQIDAEPIHRTIFEVAASHGGTNAR